MSEESTTHLNNILNSEINKTNLDKFIKQYQKPLPNRNIFSEYISTHPITSADIVKNSKNLISKSYIHDIIGGKKDHPSRDITLILCIASHMNRKETRRTLENYGHRDLYSKDVRDIIIATYINNKEYDLTAINEELNAYDLQILESKKLT